MRTKAQLREYHREYYRQHKEEIKEQHHQYYLEHKEEICAKSKLYNDEHRQQHLEYMRKYMRRIRKIRQKSKRERRQTMKYKKNDWIECTCTFGDSPEIKAGQMGQVMFGIKKKSPYESIYSVMWYDENKMGQGIYMFYETPLETNTKLIDQDDERLRVYL